MGAEGKKENSFILQAGVLAMAGIIVRIIGMLYRSPLTAIIGDEGNGYYSYAYNIYANILLISSYSIPSAISKVMAQKLALKEYRNAHRIFRCALVYVTVVGILASLFAFFAAPFLVVDNAVMVLRVFAPTIFLSGFLGVLRGYFQAQGSMVQTSLSQIIEQILNALVSIGAAYGFIQLAHAEDTTARAIYGASGSALGTGCGVVAALLFMFYMYMINKDTILKKAEKDQHSEVDSYAAISKTILFVVTPFILSTFIYNCTTAVNQTIYTEIVMKTHEYTQQDAAVLYGVFSGKAVLLRNVPVALASAMSSAIIPGVTAAWSTGQKKDARRKVEQAMRMTMLIAIPASFGLAFFSKPIIMCLFHQKATLQLASLVLTSLSVTVCFYCISTITNGVLQSIEQVNKPVIHAAIALGVQAIVLVVFLKFAGVGLYGLVIADVVYSVLMCVLNGYTIKKKLHYKQEWMDTFLKPAICSAIVGLITFGIYKLLDYLTGMFFLAMVIAIGIFIVLYFVLILLSGGVTEQEVRAFPKGHILVKIAKKLHLLRQI